jgi:PD-(D/E)XK nuclease superfamily
MATRNAPEDAPRLYRSRGDLLTAALNGRDFNPGTNCADCGFLNVCPAVPQRRGVLGIPGRAVATRGLSATHLGAYNRCPTAFLAQRRDHLPAAPREDDNERGAAARARGIAAHAVLRWLHARQPAVGCTPDDLPDPLDDPEVRERSPSTLPSMLTPTPQHTPTCDITSKAACWASRDSATGFPRIGSSSSTRTPILSSSRPRT